MKLSCSLGYRRKLRGLINKCNGSDPSAEVVEQRIVFRDRLLKFRHLQRTFQPEVTLLLTAPPTSPSIVVSDDDDMQTTNLLLPSSLPPETLIRTSAKLVKMEKELRLGQCEDGLTQLRGHLHSQARLLKFKYVNVRHQVPNTRSRGLLDRVSAKISTSAEKYRAAYAALLALDPDPAAKWKSELRPLNPKDVRPMFSNDPINTTTDLPSDEDNEVPVHGLLRGGVIAEGSRTLSWIWIGTPNDTSSASGYHECKCTHSSLCLCFAYHHFPAFRIEWCKARARRERWKEEILLLKEEMRRTLVFFKYRSEMWSARACPSFVSSISKDPTIREGLGAYAHSQSHVFGALRDRFHSIWNGLEKAGNPDIEPTPVMSEDALMEEMTSE